MSKLEFDDLIESVRTAIELGTHPKLISQGSSGSYFARNTGGKVVGVFKPKDEEPYANKNPKWTKWLHRNLLPFAFGRAMLIPNLSYVSEAAAYVLDCQLRTNLVPYTDVVNLSSKSFHYDWMERRAYYRKKRSFPEKPGSFQVFLKGFKGATDFFQEHPWPDQQGAGVHTAQSSSRRQSGWTETCRPTGTMAGREDHDEEEAIGHPRSESNARRREFWTEDLQQRFREELEKLVILDYIMRNTDRGTDNWMIRVDQEEQESSSPSDASQGYDRRTEHMTTNPIQRNVSKAVPRIGAIDNSLSWPWKHPDAWRSYPFGWLFLPVTLIGRPFSENTRNHFLPLLTSKDWWRDTSTRLRTCFELDADFQEKMFARQMAVMKGQAWNVVETLKTADHGPLELTRRNRVLVWDDIVEIPVAIPLPRASEEMRSRAAASKIAAALDASQTRGLDEDEEMDISAALSGAVPQHKDQLLDVLTTIQERPNRNPFNVSRQNSSSSIRPDDDADARNVTDMPVKIENDRLLHGSAQPVVARAGIRPGAFRSRTSVGRTSNELPRRAPWATPPSERRRRFQPCTWAQY